MGKLTAPYIGRGSSRTTKSAFNEGAQIPQAEFDKVAAKNPALKSKNRLERSEAMKKEILTGEFAKFRRR